MRINGLHEIASRFDGMLIDQFGVIHDGQKLYPGAARVLAELHARKPDRVLATNVEFWSAVVLDVVHGDAREMEIRYAMSDNIGLGGHNGAVIFKRYDGD